MAEAYFLKEIVEKINFLQKIDFFKVLYIYEILSFKIGVNRNLLFYSYCQPANQ